VQANSPVELRESEENQERQQGSALWCQEKPFQEKAFQENGFQLQPPMHVGWQVLNLQNAVVETPFCETPSHRSLSLMNRLFNPNSQYIHTDLTGIGLNAGEGVDCHLQPTIL
jgi:hypothetical protein